MKKIIVGSRQTGKTTLIEKIANEYNSSEIEVISICQRYRVEDVKKKNYSDIVDVVRLLSPSNRSTIVDNLIATIDSHMNIHRPQLFLIDDIDIFIYEGSDDYVKLFEYLHFHDINFVFSIYSGRDIDFVKIKKALPEIDLHVLSDKQLIRVKVGDKLLLGYALVTVAAMKRDFLHTYMSVRFSNGIHQSIKLSNREMFSEFATTTLREDLELERLTKAKAVNGVITVGVFSDLHGLAEAAGGSNGD